jgi:hypothetical protein
MKKNMFVPLLVVLALILSGCSRTTSKAGGFSLILPENWQLAGQTGTSKMIKEFIDSYDVSELAFLYTNNSHGRVLIIVGPPLSKEEVAALKTDAAYKPNVTLGKTAWKRDADEEAGTLLVRRYRVLRVRVFGGGRAYNVVVSADRINNNFDTVYAEEDALLNSLKIK